MWELPRIDDTASYDQMLLEARAMRGTSLSRDAWSRMRRNRAALVSAMFLLCLSVLALLTPLLPLDSPQRQYLGAGVTNRQLLPPSLTGRRIEVDEPGGTVPLSVALRRYDERARRSTAGTNSEVSHPFVRVWHDLRSIDYVLVRCRLWLFGDWCLPSLCGTDPLGRDVLSRLLWGTRVSLSVGAIAGCVSLVIGVFYGAISGYFGGIVDSLMMRFVDVLSSIPFIFVVIFAITVLGKEEIRTELQRYGIERITIFYLLIGAIYWLTMARVVRGQVISLRNEPFVEAARVLGAGHVRIILFHLLPNLVSIVIVYLTLMIPSIILFEAFLSFLGLGVEPPNVSWGILANDGIQAITPLRSYWWLVLFPGLTLSMTLLALNFFGDGLRDALDPRLRQH